MDRKPPTSISGGSSRVSQIERVCNLFGIDLKEIYQEDAKSKVLAPTFNNIKTSLETFEDIAEINKLALNIIEMRGVKPNNIE